jgi:hypothetical protein
VKCHHYCNTIRCPECVKRFWKNHTRGRKANVPAHISPETSGSGFQAGVSFYEAAAKKN